MIVRHAEDSHKWEKHDLLTDDETDFLQKLLKSFRQKKSNKQNEQLLKMTPSMIKKCYSSIEMVYKEILTENYCRIEYEAMRLNDPYVCTRIPKGFVSQ